ncbi:MAG: ATP-binding protein [Cyanobacteriota bacterium]
MLHCELEKHKDNLEQKVKEQTRDLQDMVERLQCNEEELSVQNEELRVKKEELIVQNEELEDLNLKLIEANRHKNFFLSTMSHELRTPLNAILGFSQSLSMQYFGMLNEKQIEYVNLINSSGSHLLDLINDILDIAKIDAGTVILNIESFCIHEIIEVVNSMIKTQYIAKNITCEYVIDSNISIIKADIRRFKQILINLLSNAHKYSLPNTTIKIEVSKVADNVIKISIIDSGIGIKKEDLKNMFLEFYQTDHTRDQALGGTGIGLALTKRLVLLHHGEIGVESELNKGSTFWFTLPIVDSSG